MEVSGTGYEPGTFFILGSDTVQLSMDHILKTGQDQAELYADISDKLGVDKAYVVGASEGGFIGSNFALHFPERVEKLILLGPMGYAGAAQSILRITFAQLFPLRPIQESTFRWAFSDSPRLVDEFGEWFRPRCGFAEGAQRARI